MKFRESCSLALLVAGVTCLIVFVVTDYVVGAAGRHVLSSVMAEFFRGDCSKEQQPSVDEDRSVFSPFRAVPPSLNGLRLGIHVFPLDIVSKEGNLTFTELGSLGMSLEVENNLIWIMNEPERNITSVFQPINNINLLDVLIPLMLMDMAPGIPKEQLPTFPLILHNVTLFQNILDAYEKVKQLSMTDKTIEENLLELHNFLLYAHNSALSYNGSSLELTQRNFAYFRPKTVYSLPPLSPVAMQYFLPGFRDVVWDYLSPGHGDVIVLSVDRYKLIDIWKPSLLCQFSDHFFLHLQGGLNEYGVYLAAPESINSKNFALNWTGKMPFSATLDVYRPLGVPVGGTLTALVNVHIPANSTFGILQGEVTPVIRVTVILKALPEKVMVWLVRIVRLRTAILLLFILLAALMFVAAVISYLRWRRVTRVTLNILRHRLL